LQLQYPFVDNVQLSGKIASEMRRAVTNSAELKGMQAVGYGWHTRHNFDVLGVQDNFTGNCRCPKALHKLKCICVVEAFQV
jgi:hypothetical protein